ncbi:MAG: glycosyltransferase family 2 protein [Pseudomonadota bacterium]
MGKPVFTLVATAKNEGPYLLEWVAYHKMIGFDHILIFQNDSDDGTHEILSELKELGEVEYRYNRAERGRHQVTAYQRAARTATYQASDYILALDIDEFLHIKCGDGTVQDLHSALPDTDRTFLNWKCFGASGHTAMPNAPVTKAFQSCETSKTIKTRVKPFKTLFKRSSFARPGVHKPNAFQGDGDPTSANGSGISSQDLDMRHFQCNDPEDRSLAQINHYMVKDPASFVLKSAKGSAHQADRPIDAAYWTARNQNKETDSSLAERAPQLTDAISRLKDRSKGKLAEHTQKSHVLHALRARQLIMQPAFRDLYDHCLRTNA